MKAKTRQRCYRLFIAGITPVEVFTLDHKPILYITHTHSWSPDSDRMVSQPFPATVCLPLPRPTESRFAALDQVINPVTKDIDCGGLAVV
jgi:hypothetical protein